MQKTKTALSVWPLCHTSERAEPPKRAKYVVYSSSSSVRPSSTLCFGCCSSGEVFCSRTSWPGDRPRVARRAAEINPPLRPISAIRPRSIDTLSPPFRPASRASSGENSWALPFSCAARPPLRAIARCFSGSIDANPRFFVPDSIFLILSSTRPTLTLYKFPLLRTPLIPAHLRSPRVNLQWLCQQSFIAILFSYPSIGDRRKITLIPPLQHVFTRMKPHIASSGRPSPQRAATSRGAQSIPPVEVVCATFRR